jgi:flagellum-specific ATP synthase
MSDNLFENVANKVENLSEVRLFGRVSGLKGLLIESKGLHDALTIGTRCTVRTKKGKNIPVEVVGFEGDRAMMMPFTSLDGVGVGCEVFLEQDEAVIYPHEGWVGRVIDAFGEPMDDKGMLPNGAKGYPIKASPPPAHKRNPVRGKIDLGVRSMNTFLTCCLGQRMGIFAGSGVGKSMLISMLTRFSEADIRVIGLIGERGREVYEFINEYLGEEGMKNTIIIVATSDQSALLRKQAAYVSMAVAEFYRDLGKDVLLMMDSVTRFAMAQREIGLSAGEPPATKGYTPTVFAELPKLLERAGPGTDKGSITGLFTVLVEGDDHNEPISDAVRGILDGHIVLERSIAERGRYPAINILRSVSRTMPGCNTPEQTVLVEKAKALMAVYDDMKEMIRLGAYRKGSDAQVDEAIFYHDMLEEFLSQNMDQKADLDSCYAQLNDILSQNPQ